MRYFNILVLFLHAVYLIINVNGGDILNIMEDCGSTGGSITALDLEGCDGYDDDYCEIHLGRMFREKLTFSSASPAQYLECNVFLSAMDVDLPAPGGCQGIDPCSVNQ